MDYSKTGRPGEAEAWAWGVKGNQGLAQGSQRKPGLGPGLEEAWAWSRGVVGGSLGLLSESQGGQGKPWPGELEEARAWAWGVKGSQGLGN